jgi:hypothetical protein
MLRIMLAGQRRRIKGAARVLNLETLAKVWEAQQTPEQETQVVRGL